MMGMKLMVMAVLIQVVKSNQDSVVQENLKLKLIIVLVHQNFMRVFVWSIVFKLHSNSALMMNVWKNVMKATIQIRNMNVMLVLLIVKFVFRTKIIALFVMIKIN